MPWPHPKPGGDLDREVASQKLMAMASLPSIPVRFKDRVVGVLDLHSQHSTQHTRHELIGLQSLPTSWASDSATLSCTARRSCSGRLPKRPITFPVSRLPVEVGG